jgi:hypothetical protein
MHNKNSKHLSSVHQRSSSGHALGTDLRHCCNTQYTITGNTKRMLSSPALCIHLGRTRYSYNPRNMPCGVRLLAFHITTNLVEYSFGKTKAQVRKMRTDRTYFETHSTRPQGGKEEKKRNRKKVRTSVEHRGQTFYTISRVSWPRGGRRDEQ